MSIEVRSLQLKKSSWALPLVEGYRQKISHFHKVEFRWIKNESNFLNKIEERDWVVACDERGNGLTSKAFAGKLEQWLDVPGRKIVFIVGGPFGLPETVKERANMLLRLSDFVFNQEVALSVLAEQIFRGFTIINNHPYHNE